MIWAIIGTLAGISIGLLTQYSIPVEYTKYTAIIIIAILDSIFGAVRAEVEHKTYDSKILLSGLILNTLLATLITFLGEKVGLDLYLAVSFVFIFRIFTNLGKIRRAVIEKLRSRKIKW